MKNAEQWQKMEQYTRKELATVAGNLYVEGVRANEYKEEHEFYNNGKLTEKQNQVYEYLKYLERNQYDS